MGVFTSITANEPTQLWISARILESVIIFHYSIISLDKVEKYNFTKVFKAVFIFLLIYLIAIILSIFVFNIFPDCFIEGYGLTWFKKITKYAIILILLISLFLSKADSDDSFYYFRLAIIFTIFSEFSFTLYKDVYGLFNMIGHIFKYFSFIFIYRYVMINIIESPYSKIKILAGELQNEKQQLISAKNEAEKANKAKSVVNKLVKILNGTIDVKSKIGEGSLFSIVLNIDESKYQNLKN